MRVAMGLAINEIDREAPRHRVLRTAVLVRLHELARRRCSTPAPCARSSPPATSPPCRTISTASSARSRTTRCCPSLPAVWATTGAAYAPWRPHQGHQRQDPGRRALPEGRQRHRRGRQPGRQAQGRGLRLPGNLAPRHRGIPRAAQEHRRRPPPHARHEHRQLDSRPVHEARRRGRRVDAVLAQRDCPICTTSSARPSKTRYTDYEAQGRARRDQELPQASRPPTCGARCSACCSRPATPGSPSRIRATCARRSSTSASCTAPTCAPRSR